MKTKKEIIPVVVHRPRQEPLEVSVDEHPRPEITLEKLASLPAPFREGGKLTAGHTSGVNDCDAAILMISEEAAKNDGLVTRGRVIAAATTGVEPRVMGYGPLSATCKLLDHAGIGLQKVGVIEINEAFASQILNVTRALGLADDEERVNPNGEAIALGYPLGMSGTRLVLTSLEELQLRGEQYAHCTMCIGVGQGISILFERI